MIIVSLMTYLEQKLPQGIEVNTADKRVVVSLQKFKEFEKVLEHMDLKTIIFEEDSVNFALMII